MDVFDVIKVVGEFVDNFGELIFFQCYEVMINCGNGGGGVRKFIVVEDDVNLFSFFDFIEVVQELVVKIFIDVQDVINDLVGFVGKVIRDVYESFNGFIKGLVNLVIGLYDRIVDGI